MLEFSTIIINLDERGNEVYRLRAKGLARNKKIYETPQEIWSKTRESMQYIKSVYQVL